MLKEQKLLAKVALLKHE